MRERKQTRNKKQPILSQFTIYTLLVLILVLLAAAWWAVRSYQVPVMPTAVVYRPSATLTPTITQTPTPTPTSTRTPRPTWTIRPRLTDTPTATATPSLTLTATRLPTITPARPYKYNDRYVFLPWSADQAQRAAQMAGEYPDIQFPKPESKTKPAYQAAFAVSAYAYRETLLRYPDDSRAVDWQWRLAYSLAHVGDPEAVKLYAGFIQEALKKGNLRSEDLPEWFQLQEPRLTLQLDNIPPEPGQLNQDLIQIMEGSVYLWLVETPSDVRVSPVTEAFNFAAAPGIVHLLSDLTGDGKTEVVIYQPDSNQASLLAEPRVFSLTGAAPAELPVQPSQPYDLQTEFTASLEENSAGGTVVKADLFPACPVTIARTYSWNGERFIPAAVQVRVDPQPSLAQFCEPGLTHALSAWPASENLALIEALLPLWPPEVDLDKQPYPADAKDEMHYRLGIYQALTGQFDQAVKTLLEVKKSPIVADSRWILPADQFLKIYQSPADLYRACQQDESCNLHSALELISLSSQVSDPAQAQEDLRRLGAPIRAAGIFDFDQDGQAERWITMQQRPGQNLEFWILTNSPTGTRALFVDLTWEDRPAPYYNEPATKLPPVFQIEAQKGFQLKRIPESGEPYIVPAVVAAPLTTYTRDTLQEAQEALLTGVDPGLVRDSLLDVLNSGRFNCINHRICDRFYYTLGLAYELAGDAREAIDTYIKLWWENSQSPYTKIARMKIGLITPTPSPTRAVTTTGTPGLILAETTPTPVPTDNTYPAPNPYP